MTGATPTKRTGLFARFRKDRGGATAVEFSLVAVPFLIMLFAVLETALVFFVGQFFETAVSDASRLILTGQAQSSKFTENDFRTAICNRVSTTTGGTTKSMFFDCSKIILNVSVASTFTKPAAVKYTSGKLDTTGYGFSMGTGGQIVVVQAIYEWPILLDFMGFTLETNKGSGKHLLVATAAFQNEPF